MHPRGVRASVAAVFAAALLFVLVAPANAAPRARASVIGGSPAALQDWAFTAAITTPRTLCTGSVVSPTKILTAAHCAGTPSGTTVRTNSTSAFEGGESSAVSSAVIAPGYRGFFADVAVLTLSTPTSAAPIQLASAAESATYTQAGAPLEVAGFGERNPLIVGRPQFGELSAVNVAASRCFVPTWVVCDSGRRAGVASRRFRGHRLRRQVNRGICQGDSGGPLVARTPAGPRLVGIAEATSSPPKRNPFFFVRCGLKGFPSIHTRVSSFIDFIVPNSTTP